MELNGTPPFTKAVAKFLPSPGAELTDLLRDVRKEVYVTTMERQRPWVGHDLGR